MFSKRGSFYSNSALSDLMKEDLRRKSLRDKDKGERRALQGIPEQERSPEKKRDRGGGDLLKELKGSRKWSVLLKERQEIECQRITNVGSSS